MSRLLRVSDFCQRFPQLQIDDDDEDDDCDEKDGTGKVRGRYVDNLSAVTLTRTVRHRQHQQPVGLRRRPRPWENSSSQFSPSSSSSIYVPPKICSRLSIQEGDLAWLSVRSTSMRKGRRRRVPVRIVVHVRENDDEDLNHSHKRSGHFNDSNDENILVVQPIILANLGIPPIRFVDVDDDNNHVPITGFRLERMMKMSATSSNENNSIAIATKVILQPLGRRPPTCFELLLLKNRRGKEIDDGDKDGDPTTNSIDGDQNDTVDDDDEDENTKSWSFPSPNSKEILQETQLLSVVDCKRNETFYYQVMSIESDRKREHDDGDDDQKVEDNDDSDLSLVFSTGPQTMYEIDSTMLPRDAVRRLPPLCSPGDVPPHPDWKSLAKLIIQTPVRSSESNTTRSSVTSTRIIHVVGTDADHDLQRCVETASNMVGLQCFTVRGLAAFAYNQGDVVRNGSIVDQLMGVEAAFRFIRRRRMEPCVVHIEHIDQEFSSTDEQLRQDQEDRFWNKILDELGAGPASSALTTKKKKDRRHDSYSYTPPIIAVFSTGKPLRPGPLLNGLVLPSIELSFPDENYTHFLWSREAGSNKESDSVQHLEPSDLELLRGRPVREIIQLRRQMNKSLNHEETATHRLEKLCQDLDAARRANSSDVSHVSRVKWIDVGGLAHVRTEIMDAIELPLKYPHLFPNNAGGRTGILLYGPPGTGKTLVAKAVATECGLPFLSVKGPELLGSYVGESEANVRKIFSSARQAASKNLPIAAAILFFDELDSLAPKRGEMNHGGGVMERVVATLLAELDGSTTSGSGNGDDGGNERAERVFVLGATNRPDLLDPSLIRPGRLDRLVYLGIPTDDEERAKILASQLRKMKVNGDAMELAREVVSSLPPRLSGADFSKLSSGAMLRAVQRLCNEAEQELTANRQEADSDNASCRAMNKRTAIDRILEAWGPEKCTPTITIQDLQEASQDVTPSITEEELARYEQMRDYLK